MIPVPLVSVMNCERKPISPRAGIRNSSRTRPLPLLTIFVIMPRALADLRDDDALMILGHVDDQLLDRLDRLAVDLLGDDVRTRDLDLEPFAPHHLDQNRQLQLAAADDLHLLGRVGRLDADRHVAEQLAVQPILAAAAT